MDFSDVVGAVDFGGVVIALLGIASVVMAVLVIQYGVSKVLAMVGGGGERDPGGFDEWDGYTAADDARDRAAAGLGPNPDWDESALLHK